MMGAKKQTVSSKNMHEDTKLALTTNLDRPVHYDRDAPFPIKQYHHMRCGDIFTELRQVELEIIEKLQKLKMECFGDDTMNDETQTVLSDDIYKDENPVRMYYLAIEEKSIHFEIPKSSEAFRKLWLEELEIIERLQKLKLNQVKLEHRKKCFSTYNEASYTLCNTRQKIEWKVKEIEDLKRSLQELYVSKRRRQRKESNISSLHEQIVKLHNGRHHGSNNLVKERQLLKKINQAREEVEKISANSPSEPVTRIYTWRGDILDTKEALTDYIKVTSKEVKELRMKQMTYRAYDGGAELERAATGKEIKILERKLDNINQKKSKLASKRQLTA